MTTHTTTHDTTTTTHDSTSTSDTTSTSDIVPSGTLGGSVRHTAEQRRSYDTVPFFRKRWMITVLFLLFIPAMIAICLTGTVYQNDKGQATEWTDKQRYQAAIGGAVFMAVGLLRLFAMPAS